MTWLMRALALLLVAAVATPARAGVLEETRVHGWIVGAYSSNQTGRFSHCATSVPYKSGISLFFHLTKDYRWSMGLANPRWRLNRGATFYVTYYIDDGPRIRARGRATRTNFVSIPLADSRELFERFQRGRRLHVVAARDSYAFNLTNSSTVLARVLRCVQRRVPAGSGGTVANPFSPGSPGSSDVSARRSSADRSELRTEATTVAANVLAASGIQGFRILPRGEIPFEARRFDAVWVADGGLLGTVTIVNPRRTSKVEDVVAAVLALDAKRCKGAFKSGRYPTQGASGTGRLMTVCDGASYPETQYTVALRPGGGFYVLGVTGKGLDSGMVLDAGTKLYDVALKTLSRR